MAVGRRKAASDESAIRESICACAGDVRQCETSERVRSSASDVTTGPRGADRHRGGNARASSTLKCHGKMDSMDEPSASVLDVERELGERVSLVRKVRDKRREVSTRAEDDLTRFGLSVHLVIRVQLDDNAKTTGW